MPEDNFHPVANLFPPIEGADFDALVNDIKENGLREAIWRHREGSILDGRSRWRACKVAGIACPSRIFEGADDEILAFVISQNLHRRHLDAGQRAMIAAQLANLGEGRPDKTAQNCAVSQEQAANLLGVSRRTVQDAAKVQRDGAPELVRAVEQGQMSVSKAAVITRECHVCIDGRPVRVQYSEPERTDYRRIRLQYSEPEGPRVVRVPVVLRDLEPRPLPDFTRIEERSLAPGLCELRAALQAPMRMSPKQAAEALPADWRDEFVNMAQQQKAWFVEFLRLLEAS